MGNHGIAPNTKSESVVGIVNYTTEADVEGENFLQVSVRIEDGRIGQYTLNTSGFELSPGLVQTDPFKEAYESGALDCDIHAEVRSQVYPQVARALQRKVNASKVVPFDHVFRRGEGAAQADDGFIESPIRRVHNDYTLDSGYIRARMELTPFTSKEELDVALRQRFAIINVWTPLKQIKNDPLACIDYRSTAPGDVQVRRLTFETSFFPVRDTYRVYFNADHKWVYFSDMKPDECILLKTFDSSDDPNVAKMALHAAATLRDGEMEPFRESLEIRCLAFYGSLAEGFGEGYAPPPGQAGQLGGPHLSQDPEYLPRCFAKAFDDDFISMHRVGGSVPNAI